jgi:hypothetical protein
VSGSRGPGGLQPPLRFVQNDVDSFADVLKSPRCGFTVDTVPSSVTASDLRQILLTAAEDCNKTDTLLWYFAGHGKLHRGSLQLLLDTSDLNRPLATC